MNSAWSDPKVCITDLFFNHFFFGSSLLLPASSVYLRKFKAAGISLNKVHKIKLPEFSLVKIAKFSLGSPQNDICWRNAEFPYW